MVDVRLAYVSIAESRGDATHRYSCIVLQTGPFVVSRGPVRRPAFLNIGAPPHRLVIRGTAPVTRNSCPSAVFQRKQTIPYHPGEWTTVHVADVARVPVPP